LILLAAILARQNFDWTNPIGWIFVGGLATMLTGIVVLYIAMQARLKYLKPQFPNH
jgi:zinc transporter ZupT